MLKRLLLLALLASLLSLPMADAGERPKNINERRQIGTSVKGRPILAFRVGDPEAKVKAVVLGSIHGNEKAGIVLVPGHQESRRIKGIDLWVVPDDQP